MNSINKVILVGHVGADPKSALTKEGKTYATFSVATNRHWKNADGKNEEATEWHKIYVWGKQAENCLLFIKKGSPVCVEGRISTFTREENGQKTYYTSISAEDVVFLPSPKGRIQNQH